MLAGNMPAAFQVLLQLRALWTGLMFWWILKRRLSNQQWAALGVLCVGAIVSQSKVRCTCGVGGGHVMPDTRHTACRVCACWHVCVRCFERGTHARVLARVRACVCARATCATLQVFTAEEAEEGAGSAGLTVVALLLTLLYTWISVGAGVYNELLLKTGGSRSIHLANVPLYMWGVALNLLILAVQGSGDGDDGRGFWAGWEHASTWVLMVLQSFIGLGVSVVMKRFDNVVKILCVAASNVVVYLFGVVVMGYEIEASFAVGGAMVMAAAYAYTKASVVQDGRDPAKRHGDASPSTPAKPA